MVFPRNQYNSDNIKILKDIGINSFRGNENAWFYKPEEGKKENLIKRAFRFLDAYINLSGHNCYSLNDINSSKPFNIPSSRFLRPFSKKLAFLDELKLQRILKSMTYAAKNNQIFHLWWHPHNFGINIEENFKFLQKILNHYSFLNNKFDFKSSNMKDISNILEYDK